MPGQQGNVFDPVAKRRHSQPDDVQAVEQVTAESARCDLGFEGAVRRGHDAHINPPRDVLADAPHFALLEHAQQLRLGARRKLAHLVENEGAAVRFLEETRPLSQRTGECSPCMAEELRFEQFLCQCRAVQRADTSDRAAVRAGESPAPPVPCRCRFRLR